MKHKRVLTTVTVILLAACAAPGPSEDIFASAQQAVEQAEAAGGEEYAPMEMRFAREKLSEAREGVEKRQNDVASYLIEQAEINAELAIAKSAAAQQRNRVSELRRAVEVLEEDLNATYGEDFQP